MIASDIIPTITILRDMRADILRLAEQYGASDVRVFGSVARDEATSESDIDLLVSFPETRSIFDMVSLWLDLKDLLGREVSLVPDTTPDRDFVRNILRDAVSL